MHLEKLKGAPLEKDTPRKSDLPPSKITSENLSLRKLQVNHLQRRHLLSLAVALVTAELFFGGRDRS